MQSFCRHFETRLLLSVVVVWSSNIAGNIRIYATPKSAYCVYIAYLRSINTSLSNITEYWPKYVPGTHFFNRQAMISSAHKPLMHSESSQIQGCYSAVWQANLQRR